MTATAPAAIPANDRELVLDRRLAAPRAAVWRCWTEPELLKQWFAPLPWTTADAELDVRAGGTSRVVMRSPDGDEFPNRGLYLEVVPGERLVFTDAFVAAWQPSDKPFMVVELTMADEDGGTRYTARARHWSVADRETHEQMGFHDGWGQCASQLETLAQSL
ncbi:SRPBCC family protein [Chelatococcus reniformis]|nr:SRPBCC family protein [Chelatococcus reniformis]